MPNFHPRIRAVDEDRQTVHWYFNGKPASIVIDGDRTGGVWTKIGGGRIRVTAIPAK